MLVRKHQLYPPEEQARADRLKTTRQLIQRGVTYSEPARGWEAGFKGRGARDLKPHPRAQVYWHAALAVTEHGEGGN
eukprot:777686-Pelagomonas_calceolata.AAC.1